MSELVIEVEELYFAGLSVSDIQNVVQLPEQIIQHIINQVEKE